MDLIYRPNYSSKLDNLLGKGVMIVLTGQRRVGKSYVMKELVARKGNEPGNNVIYIDKGKRLSTLLSPIRIWSPMLTRR